MTDFHKEKLTHGLPEGVWIEVDTWEQHPRRFDLVVNGVTVATGQEWSDDRYERYERYDADEKEYPVTTYYGNKRLIDVYMLSFRAALVKHREEKRAKFLEESKRGHLERKHNAKMALRAHQAAERQRAALRKST
jgi:hypothetical protein